MRLSAQRLRVLLQPLLELSPEQEGEAALTLLRFSSALALAPKVLRSLADRSTPTNERASWLTSTLGVSKGSALDHFFSALLENEAFTNWTRLFQEYLRLRQRLGFARLYTAYSAIDLSQQELTQLTETLTKRFETPALVEVRIDPTVGAGLRLETPDGWEYDDSLTGRLTRLATTLAA